MGVGMDEAELDWVDANGFVELEDREGDRGLAKLAGSW